MKAKGASGSRRFSARLKWTRPTKFQAGFSVLRKSCRPVPETASDDAVAATMALQRERSTSVVRYSAPAIIGAVRTRVASSASPGGGILGRADAASVAGGCRERRAAKRAEKVPHHTQN